MMSYENFRLKVKSFLDTRFGDRYQIVESNVVKNNDKKLTGVCLTPIGEKSIFAPTIYYEDMYHILQQDKSLEEVLEQIEQLLTTTKIPEINIDEIMKFDLIKDRICCSIVNSELSKEMLSKLPHKKIYDLSIYFYIRISEEATAKVTEPLLNEWNVSVDSLLELAKENMQRINPPQLTSMNDLIYEMMISEGMPVNLAERMFKNDDPMGMYVLTNNDRVKGAINFILSDKVKELSTRLDRDLMVIPSSIHEVILLPIANDTMSVEELRDMVESVNDSQVSDEDRLSYSVYRYDRHTQQLAIC